MHSFSDHRARPTSDELHQRAISDHSQPLDATTRQAYERGLGDDLAAVRVHTGSAAHVASLARGARGYTIGDDIVLASEAFWPNRTYGNTLLAHELAHVVQQRRGPQGGASPPADTETEAQRVGEAITRGDAVPAIATTARQGLAQHDQLTDAQKAAAKADLAQRTAEQAAAAAAGAQTASAGAQSAAQHAQLSADDAIAKANAALDAAKFGDLVGIARSHIGLAYTAYVSACKDVKESIHAAARQNAEMMALVLDIAMGFTAPGLAKGLAGWADRIPIAASTLEYRVALAALSTERVRFLFTSATKAAGASLKRNAVALAGETEVDAFVGTLEVSAQAAFQQAGDELGKKSAVEVGTVASFYDASVANRDTYREQIKALADLYQRDVGSIGTSWAMSAPGIQQGGMPIEVAWVEDHGNKRLALVEYQPGFLGIWGNKYWVHNWIVDSEMVQLAISKQYRLYGRLDTINIDETR